MLVADDGTETLGGIPGDADRAWLDALVAGRGAGPRSGAPATTPGRDAVGRISAGLALTVDYGHLRDARPPLGTLTGFRDGREAAPVPDGLR